MKNLPMKSSPMNNCIRAVAAATLFLAALATNTTQAAERCPATQDQLVAALKAAVQPAGGPSNGGLDNHMWATLVSRDLPDRPLTERLCHACRQLLAVDSAAITVQSDETSWVTLCATSVVAARLEDLQDVIGEGPSRDAFLYGELTVTTFGDDSDRRWPEFHRAAQPDAERGDLLARAGRVRAAGVQKVVRVRHVGADPVAALFLTRCARLGSTGRAPDPFR